MKNLKKIAALVIVLAMALSTVSFAAFTDVAEDASYNEAVTVMAALDLLKGYEDGSFGPDKTITRAEFAAVVVRMLGMEDAAAGAAAATNFTDVPATHWAAGYVKIANQKGIIAGYGDGTFGPDDEVTYEQAIKMLVCALGYAPMFADVADAYPTAYMAQANTLGMTVGAVGKIGDKATRAIVARLAYNALDDKLMEQTGFGTEIKYEVPKTGYTTLLNQYLKVAKVEGTASPVSFAAEDASKIDFVVTGDVKDHYNQEYIGFSAFTVPGNDFEAKEGTTYDKLYTSIAYIDYSEGLDEAVIKAIVPQKAKSEQLVLNKDQLTDSYTNRLPYPSAVAALGSDNGATPLVDETVAVTAGDGKLTYYVTAKKESTRTDDILISKDVQIFKNNDTGALAADNTFASYNGYATFFANMSAGNIAEVTFINVDGNNTYDKICYTEIQSLYVEQINEKKMKIGSWEFDPEEEDQTYTLVNGEGKEIVFADIKVGDVLNVIESVDGSSNKQLQYIVTSNVVEGTVSEVDGNDVYIGGTAYLKGSETFVGGESGKFYVDIQGKIKKYEQDASTTTYATLMALYEDNNGASEEVKALIYTAEGKFETYGFASKVKLYDATKVAAQLKDYTGDYKDSENFTVGAANANTGIKVANLGGITINANIPVVVSYSTNSSNKINKLVWDYAAASSDNGQGELAADSQDRYVYATNGTAQFDAIDDTIGGYVVTDKSVVVTTKYDLTTITLDDGGSDVKAANKTAGVDPKEANFAIASKAIFADEEQYNVYIVADKDTDEVIYMMVLDADIKVSNDSPVMYVTQNEFNGQTADGDTYRTIRGYVDGEIVSIKVNDDTNIYDRNEGTYSTPIAVGDMIQYNEGEYASAVRVIMTKAEIYTALTSGSTNEPAFNVPATPSNITSTGAKDDKVGYLLAGKVAKAGGTSVEFVGGKKIKNSSAIDGVKVTFASGAIANVYGGYSFGDIETDDTEAGIGTNDDVVLVYCFDNEVLGFIVYDGAGNEID